MSSNGPQPSGLAEILAGLDALIAAKQREVDNIQQVLNEHLTELRRLRAIDRAANPQQKATDKSKHGNRYGEEQLKIIQEQIRALPPAAEDLPGSFTSGSLVRDLGMSKATAERAIHYLRTTEQIRLIGERVIGGTRPSKLYVLNDVE